MWRGSGLRQTRHKLCRLYRDVDAITGPSAPPSVHTPLSFVIFEIFWHLSCWTNWVEWKRSDDTSARTVIIHILVFCLLGSFIQLFWNLQETLHFLFCTFSPSLYRKLWSCDGMPFRIKYELFSSGLLGHIFVVFLLPYGSDPT